MACRILAHAGLIEDVLGHVSARLDDDTVLIRGRGPDEAGVLFTVPDDVVAVTIADGRPVAETGRSLPKELPLHLACYRDDPAVGAVVHAHPPAVVAADLAGAPLVPMIGAYNIPAARLARGGIATFPRAVLIDTDALAVSMRAAMGDNAVCVLRGHGITTTGATVEQAVGRALAVDALARMACRVVSAGGRPEARPDDELDQLPDLAPPFDDATIWRFHARRLAHDGLAFAEVVR